MKRRISVQPGAPAAAPPWIGRHNAATAKADAALRLTAGNGRFAFSLDVTGLQTPGEFHRKGMPLVALCDPGWHTGIRS